MTEKIKNPSAGLNNFQKADQIFEQTFKKNAEKINEVNGSLGQGFFDLMEESVKEGQNEIYEAIQNGDKKEEAKSLMKLNQKSSNVQNFKDTWKMIGESAMDGSLSKGMTSDDKFTLAYVTDQNNKPSVTEEGFVWKNVEMPSGEVRDITQADMNNAMVLRDEKTSKELLDLGNQATELGAKGGEFDKSRNMATIKKLITPENMRSLMFDDVLNTNISFIEDIREAFLQPEALKEMLGEAVGQSINAPKEKGESNWLDNISQADADLIEDALTNSKNKFFNADLSNEILADYFTRKIEMQHKKGAPKPEADNQYGGLTAQQLVEKYSK